MSAVRRPRSVRFRLTLSYAGAMVVVLAVYATLIFYFVSHNMSQFLDNQLKSDFDWALDMMKHDPHGEFIPSDYEEKGEGDSPWLQVLSPAGQEISSSPEAKRHPIPDRKKLAADPEEKIVHVPGLDPPWRIMSG